MAGFGGVLQMCSRNRDTTLSFFGSVINGTIFEESGKSLFGLPLRNGGGQCSLLYKLEVESAASLFFVYLSMIDVTNCTFLTSVMHQEQRADIHTNIGMRLRPLICSCSV
jgi:hypothetical protein